MEAFLTSVALCPRRGLPAAVFPYAPGQTLNHNVPKAPGPPCGGVRGPSAALSRRVRAVLLGSGDLPQHVLQDASVAVIVSLARGIDAHHGVEARGGTVLGLGGDLQGLRSSAGIKRGHT